jgi:hypothetical protein
VTGGRVDRDERRKGSESDLEITDAAWDEARREQASRVYKNFMITGIMLLNPVVAEVE